MKTYTITVAKEQERLRLDKFLSNTLSKLTREQLQKIIKAKAVVIDDHIVVKPSSVVQPGQTIVISLPFRQEVKLTPQDIPLNILYEDDAMVVINKPAGLVVHPAPGNWDGTLVNAVLGKQVKREDFTEDSLRIGLVHRLDKYTSGVIVISKNDYAKGFLGKQFQDRTTEKTYLAVVHGIVTPATGRIESYLGRSMHDRKKMAVVDEKRGKLAISEYKVLKSRGATSLLEVHLLTGRTHQIRVHCASFGHPIVGDETYGHAGDQVRFGINRFLLHAWKLRIRRPSDGTLMEFEAEVPNEFN